MNAADRFLNKVAKKGSGCWLWTGARMADGYGNFRTDGRNYRAHRFAYEVFVGPVPPDLVLDHLCRVPLCVNPDHLEPVTRRENVLRGNTLPAANAAKTHCRHGHALSGDNLYLERNGKRHCRQCRSTSRTKL